MCNYTNVEERFFIIIAKIKYFIAIIKYVVEISNYKFLVTNEWLIIQYFSNYDSDGLIKQLYNFIYLYT